MLIPNFGAVGASITTVIGQLVILFIQILITKNEIKYFSILKKSLKYILASILMLFIGLIFDYFLDNNIYSLIVIIFISAVVYLGTLVLLKAEMVIEVVTYVRCIIEKMKKNIFLLKDDIKEINEI